MAPQLVDRFLLKGRTWRQFLVGDYNYAFLCMPTWPYCQEAVTRTPPKYIGRNEPLGLFLSFVMGLQHALCMMAGLIVPPILVGALATSDKTRLYMLQSTLIMSAIASFLQMSGLRLPFCKGQRYGTGLLSIMGISFQSVPIFIGAIGDLMAQGDTFEQAYGKMLGTTAAATFVPILMSVLPMRALKRVFPPFISGVTILLICLHLVESAYYNWGGGSNCGHGAPLCFGNGEVQLPFGSAAYMGLGFLTFIVIVMCETFGSPFIRNAALMIGLIMGFIVAASCTFDGARYVTGRYFVNSPWVTFLWTTVFPISFYTPVFLPMVVVMMISCVESAADVTATATLSRLDTTSQEHLRRIQGAFRNDGLMSCIGALSGTMATTCYANNNAVLSMTNVVSKSAGLACCTIILICGICGKFGAFIMSIPNCVLGGMSAVVFANIAVQAIAIMSHDPTIGTRRTRFISTISLSLGLGVTMVPKWATNNLWVISSTPSVFVDTVHGTVMNIMSTGFMLGAITAIFLNFILPQEAEVVWDPTQQLEDETRAGEEDEFKGGDMTADMQQRINNSRGLGYSSHKVSRNNSGVPAHTGVMSVTMTRDSVVVASTPSVTGRPGTQEMAVMRTAPLMDNAAV